VNLRTSKLIALHTLFFKEILRFWRVSLQTVGAPVLSALLYLLIFSHVMQKHGEIYPGISYIAFLIPGLIIMSVLQNAFANTSSSLIQSKITGNLIFLLLSPLSHIEIFIAYISAAVVRGVCVGLGVWLATLWFTPLHLSSPIWIGLFAIFGSALLAALGLIAGIWAEKFDQIAAFQNFIIMPATFLAGVFYSTHNLPEIWQILSHVNPFFYIVDGFRYGFLGSSDIDPMYSLTIILGSFVALSMLALSMLKSGYKLRH
jgi:ABC-2 type transport system permease protein